MSRRGQGERLAAAIDRQEGNRARWTRINRPKKGLGYKGHDSRDYEEEPQDEYDQWLFHEWFGYLVEEGRAVAFDNGPGGRPRGYREKRPGSWRDELTGLPDIVSGEPGWVAEKVEVETEAWFRDLVESWPYWLPLWVEARIGELSGVKGSWVEGWGREEIEVFKGFLKDDPSNGRRILLGERPEAPELSEEEAILALAIAFVRLSRPEEEEGPGDYDPVRDAGRREDPRKELRRRRAFLAAGQMLAGLARAEEAEEVEEEEAEEEAGDIRAARLALLRLLYLRMMALGLASELPSARGKPVKVDPRLDPRRHPLMRHEDPIKSQTRRRVRKRDKNGKFTGGYEVRAVPTMRIDLHSYLGSHIRLIDDDSGRTVAPRGAIGMIKTSGGRRRQWVMPITWINDHYGYRGRSRDDARRIRLREEQQAEVIQLVDHRTGARRHVEILVTPRSRYHSLAVEFAEEFDRLAEGL